MFGAVKDNPFVAPSPSGPVDEPPLRTEPGSFTRSFADPVSPQPPSETKGNGNQKPAAFAEPNWTQPLSPPVVVPANPPEPAVPRVNADKPRESRPSVQDGATQLFSVPGGPSAPSAAPPPSGPSEYTRIISGGVLSLNSSIGKAGCRRRSGGRRAANFQDARSSGSPGAKDRSAPGAEIAEDASGSENSAGGRVGPEAKILLLADDHYSERVTHHRRAADCLFRDQALRRSSARINLPAAARSTIPWWDWADLRARMRRDCARD